MRSREVNTSDNVQVDVDTATSLVGRHEAPSVILGIALVHMSDSAGVMHIVRALIDSAS